jgi:hypothetical protein
MTPQGIAAIAGSVPAVLDRREPAPVWPPDIVVVDDGLPDASEIEEALFPPDLPGDDSLDDDKAVAELGDAPQPDLFDEGDPRRSGRPDGLETVDGGGGTAGRLRRIFGGDWPGAPGRPAPGSRFPNTDAFAFYLPWHRFSTATWGIYLTVEGIEDLGRLIHNVAGDALTSTEAKRAAKLFLFHHEAYHNAVETYAARLEVSHRHPCYRTGVVGAYAALLPETGLHEEGLANAYAHECVSAWKKDPVGG